MSEILRRNACPSLAVPMQTGDGLLARINTWRGTLSPAHLGTVATSASRHGSGIVEITRRGSLQVRGLTANSAEPFMAEVLESGLDIRSGVPVDIGPLIGRDSSENAATEALYDAVVEAIGRTELGTRLGPKVSVVIDGGGILGMADVIGDVRLTSLQPDRDVWQVAIGGTASSARLATTVERREAVPLVVELLGTIAELGRSGRGKMLDENQISAACGHLPPHRQHASEQGHSSVPHHATSPIGRIALKEGSVAVGLGLPFGQATTNQIIRLVQIAEKSIVSEFRMAPGCALLAICDAPDRAEDLHTAASHLGFVVDPDDPRLRVVACAGAPLCGSGTFNTKAVAAELVAQGLPADVDTIHVSGCAKRCAEPPSPTVSLIGDAEGVNIIEARSGGIRDHVAEREVAAAFQRVMSGHKMGRGGAPATRQRHGTQA